MKILNKFKSMFTSRKGIVAVATLGIVGVAVLTPFVKAEFYPNRPTFDYNKPCNPNDGDKYDRCGSLDGPVFNSFVNTPNYGNERAFLDARRSDQTAAGSYKNVLPNVTDGSKEIVVRMYIHNNANESTNASGKGIAKNTNVRIDLPKVEGSQLRAVGYISASNSNPKIVEDTVDFTADRKFTVQYVPGSARMTNDGPFANGVKLSDSIVTSGAPIGYNSLNGNFPGCFDYQAQVQITVKVTPTASNKINFSKEVRKQGENNWHKQIDSKPGDKVEWLLTTQNVGLDTLTNVTARDVLPPHVRLVPGSVRVIDTSKNTPQQDGPLFAGGFNLGTYPSNGGRYVMFTTEVLGDFDECSVEVRNVAFAKSTQTPNEVRSDADVVITKDDCNPPPETSFRCDALEVQKLSRTNFRFAGFGSATNATITGYIFKVNGAVAQDGTSNIYNFSNQTPGDYKVELIVKTNKGNTAPKDACTKTITVEEEPENPSYSCDLLTANKLGGKKVKITAYASASGGATIERYIFDFGDGSEKLTTDNNIVEHTYQKDGFFVSNVQVVVKVNDKLVTVSGNQCNAPVKFVSDECKDNPKTPEDECNPCVDNPNTDIDECNPTTPPNVVTTTSLPNTGPGQIVAIFFTVTTAGTLLYAAVVRRLGSIL